MDSFLIRLNQTRDLIRLSRISLHSISIFCGSSSFLAWLIPPLTTDNVVLRTGSLFYSISISIAGLLTAKLLARHSPIYTALDNAEQQDLINNLAAAQYLNSQGYASQGQLLPLDIESQTADIEDVPTTKDESLPTEDYPSNFQENYNKLIQEVMQEVEVGKSDTFIIENVLHCKGRKYQEGKKQLLEIKAIISKISDALSKETVP
ncbi:MAG: hypothetical protein F6K08_16850 [Okeania sp. SIO1H6]|nr:hypothetical protein [Okeania sp. SIO1H6]